jgi:hypothetical protein
MTAVLTQTARDLDAQTRAARREATGKR